MCLAGWGQALVAAQRLPDRDRLHRDEVEGPVLDEDGHRGYAEVAARPGPAEPTRTP